MVMRDPTSKYIQPSSDKKESQINQKFGSAPLKEQGAPDQRNFQRYNLVPPTEEDDDEMGGGEGENSDDKDQEDVPLRELKRCSVSDNGQEVLDFQKV